MTSVIDVWRAVDPEARLVSGQAERLGQPVRGTLRTRAAPPHLPPAADGPLLIVDRPLMAGSGLDGLSAALVEAQLTPSAVLLADWSGAPPEAGSAALPVLASGRSAAWLQEAARGYLDDPGAFLGRVLADLRLTAAEAALASGDPAVPLGLVAGRLRRGAGLLVEGILRVLVPRPAGRALAASFAALHARGVVGSSGHSGLRRRPLGGLWLLEQRIRPDAAVWLFDDLPLATIDQASAAALAATLRAMLARPTMPAPARSPVAAPADAGDPLSRTLLAVARANGRIAPAARALGVHRNTVLYRLRIARDERGIDPRRPEDALALLAAEAKGRGGRGPA